MGDAAQGEPIQHEVFEKPFKVEPEFEEWNTPDSYRRYPGGDELPNKMRVWRIQDTGKTLGGVVARSWGFEDSPDAEVLTPGYNRGKEHGAVGVGRHGNFLQWGYSAAPSQMTEAGRRFFLNCIWYIQRFDGKAPLIRRQSSDRFSGVRLIEGAIKNPTEEFYSRCFPQEYMESFKDDPDGMFAHYMENYELIYRDGDEYKIDTQLESLGIKSNRKLETLERLIALLKNPENATTAQSLLARYAAANFDTPAEWRAWFDKNRDRIYFSDVGGYKWRVIPEGYLD